MSAARRDRARRVWLIIFLAPAVILTPLIGYVGPAKVFGANPFAWFAGLAYLAAVAAYLITDYLLHKPKPSKPPAPGGGRHAAPESKE
ncbi:hypothetical protein ABCS02_03310 [Microbacterium sp. X-17]|uniref:hypothetical protein n=1 Tax=Microbacterium sp. X-17 TaxID=3144404 RepID=UPI0031F54F0C